MVAAEIIAQFLNDKLGKQYKMYASGVFNDRFLTIKNDGVNVYRDIDWQAFEENIDCIIGCVTVSPTPLPSTPFKQVATTYMVEFWVPIDSTKTDDKGMVIERKFSFHADMEKLINEIKDKQLPVKDGKTPLNAFFSISEPSLASAQAERSGAYKRAVFSVSGEVNLSDVKLGTGNDVKVCFKIDGTEHEIKYVKDFYIGCPTDGNEIQKQGALQGEQDGAVSSQQVTFSIDDYITTDAERLIVSKAWTNKQELTPDAEEARNKLKVEVVLYRRDELMIRFLGLLSAEYRFASIASPAGYSVGLVNSKTLEVGNGL